MVSSGSPHFLFCRKYRLQTISPLHVQSLHTYIALQIREEISLTTQVLNPWERDGGCNKVWIEMANERSWPVGLAHNAATDGEVLVLAEARGLRQSIEPMPARLSLGLTGRKTYSREKLFFSPGKFRRLCTCVIYAGARYQVSAEDEAKLSRWLPGAVHKRLGGGT